MQSFFHSGSTDLQKEIEKVIRTNVEPETARLDRMMSSKMNAITSEANNALFPTGLVKSFPANCLSLMTVTGAKGGLVSFSFILYFFFLFLFLSKINFVVNIQQNNDYCIEQSNMRHHHSQLPCLQFHPQSYIRMVIN